MAFLYTMPKNQTFSPASLHLELHFSASEHASTARVFILEWITSALHRLFNSVPNFLPNRRSKSCQFKPQPLCFKINAFFSTETPIVLSVVARESNRGLRCYSCQTRENSRARFLSRAAQAALINALSNATNLRPLDALREGNCLQRKGNVV